MSNYSTDSPTTQRSPTSLFSVSSAITESSTNITDTFTHSLFDKIADNDIISTANYLYSLFATLGLLAGCFLLYSFIQTYRAHKRLAWLGCLLWVFCGFQLLHLLLSLHIVAHRPQYLKTTALGCAALSFTINTASLCGILVLVLMASVLTFDPPSHHLLRKSSFCAALVSITSVLICLVLAGIRGPSGDLQKKVDCLMDPTKDGVSYAAARLCLVFLIPYSLQMGLLIGGCVRQWKSKGRFLSGSEEGPVFLTVSVVTLICQLFYSASLLNGALLEKERQLGFRPFLSVAEFVLFSGSSASLLFVLFLHRPCRESLFGVIRRLRDCCRRPGRTQPNRNIIAPHIEITDTLEDIES
ncbi:uncharacterized protein LOC115798268 [Archocentrus centrarchus]|uniref:uncharacterized protein LOC115798268 n=1 Tax=Archocentrus centrarchus TaxID=63155 RepID=UPI0011EA2733|nr:uncharacterized protein LOC115798268 [Archocentrus centrarchus]